MFKRNKKEKNSDHRSFRHTDLICHLSVILAHGHAAAQKNI